MIDSVYNSIMNISNQSFFFSFFFSDTKKYFIWYKTVNLASDGHVEVCSRKNVLPQIRKVNCFICRMRSLQDSDFFLCWLCYIFPQNTILRMIVNLKRIMLLLNSDFYQKNSVNFFATHLCNHHIYTYCVNIQM